jgi:Type II secretion system (T2SS), protein M subtype b
MGDLKTTRMRFWIAAGVLGLVSLALLAYLLRPGSSAAAQEALEASLQQRVNLLKAEVDKWKDSNPQRTREALNKFYADDVPVRSSQVSEQLEKIIKDTGVTAPSIRYSPEPQDKTSLPSVQQVKVETTVTGDYSKVAKFINAMEQARLLFIIDKVSLTGQEGGNVTLQITFTTFLKGNA